MKFKTFAAGIAFSLVSLASQAGITNWGAHGDSQVTATQLDVTGSSFAEYFNFDLDKLGTLGSVAVSNDLTFQGIDLLKILGGSVSLYKGTFSGGSEGTLIGQYGFNGVSGDISHHFSNLTTGKYYYKVSGTVAGDVGGSFILTSTVAAVPEPETYALLGLGLTGLLLARRKRQA